MPDPGTFFAALPLFAGTAGLIYAIARAWVLIRSGSYSHERAAIADRSAWQRALIRRAEWAELQLDWWRARAGDLEYAMRQRLGEREIPRPRPYPERPDGDDDE